MEEITRHGTGTAQEDVRVAAAKLSHSWAERGMSL